MISLFFLLFSLSYFGQAVREGCIFNFNTDIPEGSKRPIYIARYWGKDLLKKTEVLNVADRSRTFSVAETGGWDPVDNIWLPSVPESYYNLILVCPGEGNAIGDVSTRLIELTCQRGVFKYDDMVIGLSKLSCKKPAEVKFVIEENPVNLWDWLCRSRVNVGYEIDFTFGNEFIKDEKFRKLFEVCKDSFPYSYLEHLNRKTIGSGFEKQGRLEKLTGDFVKYPAVPEEDLITFPGSQVDKKVINDFYFIVYDSVSRHMFEVEKHIRKLVPQNENGISVVTRAIIGRPVLNARSFLVPLFIVKIVRLGPICSALFILNRPSVVDEAHAYRRECKLVTMPPNPIINLIEDSSPEHIFACPCAVVSKWN